VDRAEDTFRIAVQECLRAPGEYLRLDRTPAAEGKEGWVKYFPAGIVAGISPFNFPINLVAHKIAPALAAGCPIILKPSSSTPMTALMLAGIAAEAGLPAGALSVLPMRRKEGDILVEDPRIAVLSFTGSPEVGWKMKARAGKKKVILELGGNAGVIVSESADIPLAVDKCVSGSFAYSGQVCIHTQRIYVHESRFEAFSQAFLEGTRKLRYGSPLEMDTDVSVMIDEDNAERVESWVAEAVQQGAKILCGGKRKGAFMEPTVITDTRPRMKVCALEVFGPVVVLEKFSDFDAALEALNDSRYGLQAGVFTQNIEEMDKAFNKLEVGGVILNDAPTFRVDHMPYGGLKDSGLGREGVRYAMMEMLEPRILVKPL
jgi:glyceraldehyde-3-phosphate dehydrogenase (NADP+)